MKFFIWNNGRLVINTKRIAFINASSEKNKYTVYLAYSEFETLELEREEYEALMNFIQRVNIRSGK